MSETPTIGSLPNPYPGLTAARENLCRALSRLNEGTRRLSFLQLVGCCVAPETSVMTGGILKFKMHKSRRLLM